MAEGALSGIGESISGFLGGGGFLIIIMVAMFALMIIPQRKKDKKIKAMLAAVKPGDRISTIGGFYGTVTAIKDDIVTISCGPDKMRLVIKRGAIANVEDAPVENTLNDEVKQ